MCIQLGAFVTFMNLKLCLLSRSFKAQKILNRQKIPCLLSLSGADVLIAKEINALRC